MPTTAPLWPVANGPEDLLEIERTPLEDRGLPASTYDVLCRASRAVGRVPQPGSAVYSATKWGIVGLTESVRLEFRDTFGRAR